MLSNRATEDQPVNPKGNQTWISTGTTDVAVESPIFGAPEKSQFIEKDHYAGKEWGQKEKGVAENDVVREHHWLNGHKFELTLRNSEE